MTSVVSICNLALSNVGKDNIQALTDAGSEARACRQFYEHTRDTLLQAYPWSFAGKTQSMAEVENDQLGVWRYAYSRPGDCLKIRWLSHDPGSAISTTSGDAVGAIATPMGFPYEIEGGTIYCDLSPAFLHYTARIPDPTKFPPLFIDALSWHLAVRLAMPLTRDPKVRADAWQVAQQMTGAAQMADANEVRHSSDHDTEFVEVR